MIRRNFWLSFKTSVHRVQSQLTVLKTKGGSDWAVVLGSDWSPMIGQVFNTMIVASSIKSGYNDPSQPKCWKLF